MPSAPWAPRRAAREVRRHAVSHPLSPRRSVRGPERLSLHHLPYRWRDHDGADRFVPVRPGDDRAAARAPEAGAADPRRRTGGAPADQERHADHGRCADPACGLLVDDPLGRPDQPLYLGGARRDRRLRRHRFPRRLSEGLKTQLQGAFRQAQNGAAIRHCGGCRVLGAESSARGAADDAGGTVLQGSVAQPRLVVRDLRDPGHGRVVQRGQPDRRSRRPRHRAGNDRRRRVRHDRVSCRQHDLFQLPADPLRARFGGACGAVRRPGRQRARFSLVQRAPTS